MSTILRCVHLVFCSLNLSHPTHVGTLCIFIKMMIFWKFWGIFLKLFSKIWGLYSYPFYGLKVIITGCVNENVASLLRSCVVCRDATFSLTHPVDSLGADLLFTICIRTPSSDMLTINTYTWLSFQHCIY